MSDIRELAAKVDRLQNRVAALESPKALPGIDFGYPGQIIEQPKASSSESLGQKIERLIAYFERRDRENAKRAEKLECKARTSFNPLNECEKMDRSSYFFSGKSEAYANAAQKVREILGDPKPTPFQHIAEALKAEPKPEKWYVECKLPISSGEFWRLSVDGGVDACYPSEAEAWEAIRKNRVATGDKLDRRPRRIE